MSSPCQLRNISIVAHVDHGKSTLAKLLISAAGICIKLEGDPTAMDIRGETSRGTTMVRAPVASMHHHVSGGVAKDITEHERDYLITLIDSPRNMDFSFEHTAPVLRVSDGAIIVVDCVEGVCVQTEAVLRQALTERIRPVVFINKVDRAIVELQLDPEEAYQAFERTLQHINVVIAMHNDPVMGELSMTPSNGTVAMGSGLQAWAFSIPWFARMYAAKFGVEESKMRERLWGDNFFDAKNKKWIKQKTNADGDRIKRAFCQFCLDPIYQLVDAALHEKSEKLEKMLASLKIILTVEEREQSPMNLTKTVMAKFLPGAETLLEMIVLHLPSPKTAQAYRVDMLYAGEAVETDKHYMGIKQCDAAGPLVVHISKMVPTFDNGQVFAFGRVFSGTVRSGQKCRIMGSNHRPGTNIDVFDEKPIQRAVLVIGGYQEAVEGIPCGNVVGLLGVDKYIMKSATITDDRETAAYPLRNMKDTVSPVVHVEATNAADLPMLVEGLKQLTPSAPP